MHPHTTERRARNATCWTRREALALSAAVIGTATGAFGFGSPEPDESVAIVIVDGWILAERDLVAGAEA